MISIKEISTLAADDYLGNDYDKRLYLSERYKSVRAFTELLCEPLATEDFVIQSMPDVSPAKWHLAHTSWFFETFVLGAFATDYKLYHEMYPYLFNSYYVQAGERWSRPHRGMLSRPTVQEIYAYREFVDEQMLQFLASAGDALLEKIFVTMHIGLHHEQQHQELLVTDFKHVLSQNPLHPVYRDVEQPQNAGAPDLTWHAFDGGIVETGHEGKSFFYDNEKPRHKEYLYPFQLAGRLVTNGEYLAFMDDGGYENAPLWLSDGFAAVEREGWRAPLYWQKEEDGWYQFTLQGYRPVNPAEPVAHVSQFEADAYARWAGARLPTEAEWETAAKGLEPQGNFVENGVWHPLPAPGGTALRQMFGDLWEWTQSDYAPYPGYRTPEGAIGEYNGKFMSGQKVLRGGSCATSVTHIRHTYRNFFYPPSRWQFTGIRLAKDNEE